MPSREFSTASRWYWLITTGSTSLKTDPTGLRASAGLSLIWPSDSSVSWLSFSSSVIRRSSESMRRSVSPSRRCWTACSATRSRVRLAASAGHAATRHDASAAMTSACRETLRPMTSPP
jgi:hypothetical protein